MDDIIREYIDVNEELEEITQDRKERTEVKKGLEKEIKKYLENETTIKSKIIDSYKISLHEKKRVKGLSRTVIEELTLKYFISKGHTAINSKKECEEITEYLFNNRPTEMVTDVKITKPRIRRSKNKT